MAATTAYPPNPSHFSSPSPLSTGASDMSRLQSPRPSLLELRSSPSADIDTRDGNTPTRADFGGIPGQRALPDEPIVPTDIASADHDVATQSPEIKRQDSQDVEMVDGQESDNDSAESDAKKKKKGQRFFCTDFPPCNLSFTRSEHLARHVRKHTGERPFQCHCNRRFSRLDNLRQHAQTVHMNEEIPGDSLAATGTRFQRQVRTDRVRATGRSRAGTGGSISGHARGHSRNLSSSSVASSISNMSGVPDDIRRRPPPLAVASDGPHGRRIDPHTLSGAPQSTQYAYYPQQYQSGMSTPTSTVYSTGPSSPRFIQSPSMAQRPAYLQPSARRLSVPSVQSPQQGQMQSLYSPHHHHQSHGSNASINSIVSPPGSIYSHSRHESEADLEWRRRTWHPGTLNSYAQRPATSGLMYQQTPDDARPTTAGQNAATQVTRLPGIESFDHAATSSRLTRPASPMQVDGRPSGYHGRSDSSSSLAAHRRSGSNWETSLGRLDLTNTTPPRPTPPSLHTRPPLPSFSFPQAPPEIEAGSSSASSDRRRGVYGGAGLTQPISFSSQRPSPDESISSDGFTTPGTSQGTLGFLSARRPSGTVQFDDPSKPKPGYNRTDSGSHLYGSNASTSPYTPSSDFDERERMIFPAPPRPTQDMGRLAALVAVATSENAGRST